MNVHKEMMKEFDLFLSVYNNNNPNIFVYFFGFFSQEKTKCDTVLPKALIDQFSSVV